GVLHRFRTGFRGGAGDNSVNRPWPQPSRSDKEETENTALFRGSGERESRWWSWSEQHSVPSWVGPDERECVPPCRVSILFQERIVTMNLIEWALFMPRAA